MEDQWEGLKTPHDALIENAPLLLEAAVEALTYLELEAEIQEGEGFGWSALELLRYVVPRAKGEIRRNRPIPPTQKTCNHPVSDLAFSIDKVHCTVCRATMTDHLALLSTTRAVKDLYERNKKLVDFLVEELDISSCHFCEKHFREKYGVILPGEITVCPDCYEAAWIEIQNEDSIIREEDYGDAAERLFAGILKAEARGRKYHGLRKGMLNALPGRLSKLIP
jgi:hypothetical protein